MVVWIGSWVLSVATAQTVAESEHSIAYLRKRACIDASQAVPVYSPATPTACLADSDCVGPATCLHQSLLEPASTLYPDLEFVSPPALEGVGEGLLRYVPLCDDGSGDHEYAISQGRFGTPPTCAPEDYIRCGDGTRPHYNVAAGTSGDWMIHPGAGGIGTSPGVSEKPVWQTANVLYVQHYSTGDPWLRTEFEGIYDDGPDNRLSTYNRIQVDKCSPDRWTGNKSYRGLSDVTGTEVVEIEMGDCFDADGNGKSECDDNLTVPGSCECSHTPLGPPPSPDGTYDVHYHGRRIVRSILMDVMGGVTAWGTYPLVDAGDGTPAVRAGDQVLPAPDLDSQFVFTCHSMGCNGMYTMIDFWAEFLSTEMGAPVDTRAVFNNFLIPGVEVEAAISEWDGVDADGDGRPDTSAVIDDTVTIYDGIIDTVTMTGEPLTTQPWEPGGDIALHKIGWYEAGQGFAPPVDASCLVNHCPGRPWTDAQCSHCMSSVHTMLNHLQTPFVSWGAQTDTTENGVQQCADADGVGGACDFDGELSGVVLSDDYFRAAFRKQLADLFRYGPTRRCEAAQGRAPYDRVLLMSPDWGLHTPLLQDPAADLAMDPQGPIGSTAAEDATWAFLQRDLTAPPLRGLCMEERVPGENLADFGGGVPTCEGPN